MTQLLRLLRLQFLTLFLRDVRRAAAPFQILRSRQRHPVPHVHGDLAQRRHAETDRSDRRQHSFQRAGQIFHEPFAVRQLFPDIFKCR